MTIVLAEKDEHGFIEHMHITERRLLGAFSFIMKDMLRHIPVMITTLQQTVTQVDILSIHKEILIKDSDFAYDYYVGGKTGFTDTAGFTLCAAACKDGRTLVGVVFNAEDSEVRYRDLVSLFEYGFSHYTTVPVSEEEFSSLIDEARLQLDDLLADTNLYVESQTCAMSSYVTTTTERAQLGSSDKVDLSQVLVDSSASEQTINIPLCKCYSDKTYIVGSLNIEITQKGSVVEITPEKKTGLKTFRNILITFAAASGLILVLIIALLIFRRKIIQRRREQSGQRSKML